MFAVLLALGLAAPAACGGYGKYCSAWRECLHGDDADVSACETTLERDADQAGLFGCSKLFDERQKCWESQARCITVANLPNYTSEDRCQDEDDRFNSCIAH